MKKKLMALAVITAMLAIAIVGGTLAYFTDEDEKTNTFTTAKIDISLNEQQRGENGLEAFEDAKVMLPVVGYDEAELDDMGLTTAANYVDKIITVKNLSDSTDAYVRLYIAIPSVLDKQADAGMNVLHFTLGSDFETGSYTAADHANWGAETLLVKDFEINGIAYNVYYRDYNKIMAKDTETGSAAYVGFYMDSAVDYDHENECYTINDEKIDFDFTEGVEIPVYAVGVQASGFDSAAKAVEAAFGADFNPFE